MKLKICGPVHPIPERITNQFEVVWTENTQTETIFHHKFGSYDEVIPIIEKAKAANHDIKVWWYEQFTGDKHYVEVQDE